MQESNLSSSSISAGPYRKPRADVYTVLLIFALIAIIAATALLYTQMSVEYDNKTEGAPVPPTAYRVVPAAPTLLANVSTHGNWLPIPLSVSKDAPTPVKTV